MGRGHQDKVAVVTGGAGGIGQAFAQRLAQDGVNVAIADRQPADETVKLVEAAGREAVAFDCDVASQESVTALAANVQQRFGRCDILINCAGIYPQRSFDAEIFGLRHVGPKLQHASMQTKRIQTLSNEQDLCGICSTTSTALD